MELDHIGIAVEDIETALRLYCDGLGLELDRVFELADDRMKIAVVGSDRVQIELIEPLGEDTPVGKFLKKRGGGIHHICFSVVRLEEAIRELEGKGFSLIAPPRRGARGERVAFFHPRSTMGVLIELSEEEGE